MNLKEVADKISDCDSEFSGKFRKTVFRTLTKFSRVHKSAENLRGIIHNSVLRSCGLKSYGNLPVNIRKDLHDYLTKIIIPYYQIQKDFESKLKICHISVETYEVIFYKKTLALKNAN